MQASKITLAVLLLCCASLTGCVTDEAWREADAKGSLQAYAGFLQEHPDAKYAREARARITVMENWKTLRQGMSGAEVQAALKLPDDPVGYPGFVKVDRDTVPPVQGRAGTSVCTVVCRNFSLTFVNDKLTAFSSSHSALSGAVKTGLDWSQLVAAGGAAAEFKRVLQDDLLHSGWFVPAAAGAACSLSGLVQDSAQLTAQIRFAGAAPQQQPLHKTYTAERGAARQLAHRVADDLLVAAGHTGLFTGHLVMIGTRSGASELYVCDMDGENVRQITSDRAKCLAPQWAPDGRRITYTAFRKREPYVYLIDLAARNRRVIANYAGANSGGALSPDGRLVALTLSKDGDLNLYVRELDDGTPLRLTGERSADIATPCWSPDGSQIVYASDQAHAGQPQLYAVSRTGAPPCRLTLRGTHNLAPHWGANGLIAYASLLDKWQVCVLDPNTLVSQVVSPGDASYAEPCWAPDGRHIVCTRMENSRSAIYLLDTLGDPPVALGQLSGDWASPSVTAK